MNIYTYLQYIYIYTCKWIRTNVHTYTHTHIETCMHACMHTFSGPEIHSIWFIYNLDLIFNIRICPFPGMFGQYSLQKNTSLLVMRLKMKIQDFFFSFAGRQIPGLRKQGPDGTEVQDGASGFMWA